MLCTGSYVVCGMLYVVCSIGLYHDLSRAKQVTMFYAMYRLVCSMWYVVCSIGLYHDLSRAKQVTLFHAMYRLVCSMWYVVCSIGLYHDLSRAKQVTMLGDGKPRAYSLELPRRGKRGFRKKTEVPPHSLLFGGGF